MLYIPSIFMFNIPKLIFEPRVSAISGLVKQIIINAANGLIQNNTIKTQRRTIVPLKINKSINQLPPVINL